MDPSVQHQRTVPPWAHFAAFTAVVSAWLLVRPYGGIRHDARLYFAQALFGDDPAFLANDLLIANDQQMQFSVYGRLIDLGLNWLEPGTVALILTAVGLVAWILAASLLGRTLTRRWWWIIALIIPLAGSSYGPHGIFLFAEGYATPRGIAEALAVAAIAFALREKIWLAVGLAALGGLVHPLVAVSGLIAVVCIAAVRDRRWLIFVAVTFPIAVLVVWADPLQIGGADSFDAAWLSIIEDRSPQVFLRTWDSRGWELVATALVLLSATAITTNTERLRALCVGVGVAVVSGIVTTGILADGLSSVLGTQLQFWRVVWLAQLGVGVVLGIAIAAAVETRSARATIRPLLILLTMAMPVLLDGIGFACAVVVIGAVLVGGQRIRNDRIERAAITGLLALLTTVTLVQIADLLSDTAAIPRPHFLAVLPSLVPGVPIAAGVLLIALTLLAQQRTLAARVAAVVLATIMVASGWTWDARSDWIRFVEGSDQPSLASAFPQSPVLVEDSSFGFYTIFGQPVYFRAELGAGVVFSRDLAIQYEIRRRNAAIVHFDGSQQRVFDHESSMDPTERTDQDIEALCRLPDAPETLLLSVAAPGVPVVVWKPPAAVDASSESPSTEGETHGVLFRYDCRNILGSNPSSG